MDDKVISKLEVDGKVVSSIGINGELFSLPNTTSTYINPYGTMATESPIKSISDDLTDIRDKQTYQECKIYEHDRQLSDIQERVKEALMIVKYPGLIANRMLDKVDSFIAKHKRVLTDSTGTKIEMVEVSRLNEMVKQLREVVKNGNNNEGL